MYDSFSEGAVHLGRAVLGVGAVIVLSVLLHLI